MRKGDSLLRHYVQVVAQSVRMPTFKTALVQMTVAGGQVEQNLARAQQVIERAAGEGARLVVLPEAMDVGWSDPSASRRASSIPDGTVSLALRDCAQRFGVFVCAGLAEQHKNQTYNAAVLFDPTGNVLLHYRKIHELEIAHDLYTLGDRLQVVDTPLGRIGIMICADAFARGQVISRTLGFMGADFILSPCSWAVPADHDNSFDPYGRLWLDNYCPVAKDFGMWIVGVSNVGWITGGPWQGRKCIGCSLVVGPTGSPLLMGPYGVDAEAILYIDISPQPRPARGDQWEQVWAPK